MSYLGHYSGCGNTFILLDDRDQTFQEGDVEKISHLCSYPLSVDGLILIQDSVKAKFKMAFFNRDGSRAPMCGNGIRSMMQCLLDLSLLPQETTQIETDDHIYTLKKESDFISTLMAPIKNLETNLSFEYEKKRIPGYYLNSGTHHLVLVLDDISSIDINAIGSFFRHHPHFFPLGTNVNFVTPSFDHIRTFERGVEAETLACGTGTYAACYIAHTHFNLPLPIRMRTQSGEVIALEKEDNTFSLLGPPPKRLHPCS